MFEGLGGITRLIAPVEQGRFEQPMIVQFEIVSGWNRTYGALTVLDDDINSKLFE